jgi:hypothetical protein
MPPELTSRPDLLEPGWLTTVLVGPAAIALAMLWAWSVRLRGRRHQPGPDGEASNAGFSPLRLGLGFVFAAVATVSLWCGFQFLAQFLTLGTNWSLWVPAILGGLALELIAFLYQLEKNLVTRNRGRLILGLRIAALIALVLILVEPILSSLVDREINREVAILIDDSASMQLSDQRLSISEMLDRADVFQIPAVADRPALGQWQQELKRTRNQISAAAAAHRAALPAPPISQRDQLSTTLDSAGNDIAAIADHLAATLDAANKAGITQDDRNRLNNLRTQLADQIRGQLSDVEQQLDSEPEAASNTLGAVVAKLDQIDAEWQASATTFDIAWYQKLDEAARNSIAEAAARPRLELALQTLQQRVELPQNDSKPEGEDKQQPQSDADSESTTPEATTETVLAQLSERYNLRLHHFARTTGETTDITTLLPSDGPGREGFQPLSVDEQSGTNLQPVSVDKPSSDDPKEGKPTNNKPNKEAETSLTDLSTALSHVLDNTSPESLAGVLLLSDGRHNGPVPPEDALRRMGVQKSPLGAVAIGGRLGPIDASILSLSAPESIYLGDRVAVRAQVKLDGLRGKKVKAMLRNGEEIVDEETIDVADVNQRSELRFVHLPDQKGIFDYSVELEPLESELFDSNNRWDFKLAVTDERTNVLLVDSYPRWEFRYLRNLFYGRDKSVHLQYVLLNPDTIADYSPPQTITASATRDFGDAEAHRLPVSEDEWRLFDVIIFGDIAPGSIPTETWEIISRSVEERGALFVSVAGQRFMPHAFTNSSFQRLMPITWQESKDTNLESPEDAYHIELSNEGRAHPITRQSSSRSENSRIWGGLQPMHWRFVPETVKDGADVLAFARPSADDGSRDTNSSNPNAAALNGSPDSVEAAIERLANRKTYERDHALITSQRVGLGKVVSLGFDSTWRMRYGIGDTLHHRFWGQVVRWGTGDNLRSGNDFVRLGTDRLSYTPSDQINVIVKLLDEERRPIIDGEIFAIVRKDFETVTRQRLSYRSASNGIYETSFTDLPGAGEYQIEIEGDAIEKAIAADESGEFDSLVTEFMVVNTRSPVELAELTADRDFLSQAARLTGGSMVEVDKITSLIDLFGAPRETLRERRDVTLWDTWPLLLTFLGLVTTEWIVRRRSGLA